MFICSAILLFITILLLTGSLPLKAIVFILLIEIFSPYLEVIFSSLCIEICSASFEPTTITWSSEDKNVLMSLVLEIVIPFVSSSFYYVII